MSLGHATDTLRLSRILVVDDDSANVRLMERILARAGYERVRGTTEPADVLRVTAELGPDLILLDVRMPGRDGLDLLKDLAPWIDPPSRLPVIMLTADNEPETRRIALERGAQDFVNKPIDIGELLLRMHNVLETRRLQLQIQLHNQELERTVQQRSLDLEEAYVELVERLALAAEYRDDETHEHAHRVGRTSALLAERLDLGPDFTMLLRRAAPLHDVGKIGITDAIFRKPGKLTPEEFAVMQQHVAIGANILTRSASPVLQLAEEIVRTHHERWDGTGYPARLAAEEIPLAGRIVALADVFDALTHERPYKPAWSIEAALEEIRRSAGSHFDPAVVEAFDTLDHNYLLAPVEHELAVLAQRRSPFQALAGRIGT